MSTRHENRIRCLLCGKLIPQAKVGFDHVCVSIHGTNVGYTNHGCRCTLCREAHAAYMRTYMATHPKQRRAAVQRSYSNRFARKKAGR